MHVLKTKLPSYNELTWALYNFLEFFLFFFKGRGMEQCSHPSKFIPKSLPSLWENSSVDTLLVWCLHVCSVTQ